MAKFEISEHVKDKYRMKKDFYAGKFLFKMQEINMATVTLDVLDKAVEDGFDVVELVKKAEPKK